MTRHMHDINPIIYQLLRSTEFLGLVKEHSVLTTMRFIVDGGFSCDEAQILAATAFVFSDAAEAAALDFDGKAHGLHSRECTDAVRTAQKMYMHEYKKLDQKLADQEWLACALWLIKTYYIEHHIVAAKPLHMLWQAIGTIDFNFK